jgi:NADPH-dependent 2,4-dienoyl-CoA reductase/sulfur reductase-like enzyme
MPVSKIVVIGGAFSGPAAAARARETVERSEILLLVRAPEVRYAIGGLAHALGGEWFARSSIEEGPVLPGYLQRR